MLLLLLQLLDKQQPEEILKMYSFPFHNFCSETRSKWWQN